MRRRALSICTLGLITHLLYVPVVAAEVIMGRFNPSAYHGKYVVLDFWATWCGPCRSQLPRVKQFYEKMRTNQRVALVGISLDNDKLALMNMVKEKGIVWPQLYDGEGFRSPSVKQYGVRGIPHMVLLDPEGHTLIQHGNLSVIEQGLEQQLARTPHLPVPVAVEGAARQVGRSRWTDDAAGDRRVSGGFPSESHVLTPEERRRMDRALGATGNVEGAIRYDGQPLPFPAVRPQLWFQDEEQGTMVSVDWHVEGPAYEAYRVPVGQYTVTIVLDADATNPPGFPGDFIARLSGVKVRQREPARRDVTVQHLIRLLMPVDTHRPLPRSCADAYPFHESPVHFVWETVPSATRYRYTVSTRDERLGNTTPVVAGSTRLGQCLVTLPPSGPQQFYVFDLAAFDGATRIGELVIHGKDFTSQAYQFVVAE